jgi:hypothetical protein
MGLSRGAKSAMQSDGMGKFVPVFELLAAPFSATVFTELL